MQMRQPSVFEFLAPLVEYGFVPRAYLLECPQCRFSQMLDLGAHDERARCRACGESYVTPVVDESGAREPSRYYRLDGLMARAMDQDVLPMLLRLRAVRPTLQPDELLFAWPGVEFDAGDGRAAVEGDLVVSNGTDVWCGEAKKTAGWLNLSLSPRVVGSGGPTGQRRTTVRLRRDHSLDAEPSRLPPGARRLPRRRQAGLRHAGLPGLRPAPRPRD
jgi:hypothetical protein